MTEKKNEHAKDFSKDFLEGIPEGFLKGETDDLSEDLAEGLPKDLPEDLSENLAKEDFQKEDFQKEDFKDKYFRLLAEMENMRKRLQKEKLDMMHLAVENLAADLLSPLDNLENALKFAQEMGPEVKNWAIGFQMILDGLKNALSQNGITSFESLGKPFDPRLHDAVEVEETDAHPPGMVIRELVRGYRSKDRTVRAARVVVSKVLEKNK